MIILNFSHPLTDEQLGQIQALTGQPVEAVMEIPSQIDTTQPLAPQIAALVDSLGIEPRRWQSEAFLINLPSLNFSAAVLLAELHGRLGYFPPCLRLRSVPDSLVPRFEVAEILNLNHIREVARARRDGA